jgi:hypothetical protein
VDRRGRLAAARCLKHLKPGAWLREAGLIPAAATITIHGLAARRGRGHDHLLERNVPMTSPKPARSARLTSLPVLLDLLDTLGLHDLSELAGVPELTRRLAAASSGADRLPRRYDPAALPPGCTRSGKAHA